VSEVSDPKIDGVKFEFGMMSLPVLRKRMRKASAFIMSVVLVMGCGVTAPVPVSKSATTTVHPVSTVNAVLTPSPFIPASVAISRAEDEAKLYYNQVPSRNIGDGYSFSVVLDKDADFIPKLILISERGTNSIIGKYELLDKTKIESLCANQMQNPDLKVYETILVNYLNLPQDFIVRAYYYDDFILEIYALDFSGNPKIIEKAALDGGCEMRDP